MFRQRMHVKTFFQRMCAIEKLIKGGDAEPNSGEPDIFVYQKVLIKHDQTLWGRREGEGRSIKILVQKRGY